MARDLGEAWSLNSLLCGLAPRDQGSQDLDFDADMVPLPSHISRLQHSTPACLLVLSVFQGLALPLSLNFPSFATLLSFLFCYLIFLFSVSLLPFSFPVSVPGISEGSELVQLVFIPFVFHISGITLLQCLMSSVLNTLFHIFLLSCFFSFFSLFLYFLTSFFPFFLSFFFFPLYSFLLSFFVVILDAHISLMPFILTQPEAEISVLLSWLKDNYLIYNYFNIDCFSKFSYS